MSLSSPLAFASQEARCVRCRAIYQLGADDERCQYHPGVYGMGGGTGSEAVGVAVGWSCCSGDKASPGCVITEHCPVAAVPGELGDLSGGTSMRWRGGSASGPAAPSGGTASATTQGGGSSAGASSSTGGSAAAEGVYVVSAGDSIASVSMKLKIPRDKLIKVRPPPAHASCGDHWHRDANLLLARYPCSLL